MPLLPLPLLRILEGLCAFLFLGAAVVGLLLLIAGPESVVNELFGVRITTDRVARGVVFSLLISLWFAYNAIRGSSPRLREMCRR